MSAAIKVVRFLRGVVAVIGALRTAYWALTVGIGLVASVIVRVADLPWYWIVTAFLGSGLLVLSALVAWFATHAPRVFFDWVGGGNLAYKQPGRVLRIYLADVGVRNDPVGRTAAARDAAVRLQFFPGNAKPSKGQRPAVETEGQWLPTDASRDTLRVRDLPPNGQIFKIAIAYKHDDDDGFYAAGPEMWQNPDIRIPGHRLEGNTYCLRVLVTGTGMNTVRGYFLVYNPGKERPLGVVWLP